MFDMLCEANGIEHRLTKPNHPWTNGQVERMNRTLKEATVQRVAIDRTSKFAYVELHEKADRRTATNFLKALIKAVPYKIHTVLTDNGIQFTDLPKNRTGRACPGVVFAH